MISYERSGWRYWWAIVAVLPFLTIACFGGSDSASEAPPRSESAPPPACDLVPLPVEVNERLRSVKLMNYAPSAGAQTTMWTDWDPERLRTDFAGIASLNANTVRLFLYVPLAGFPEPTSEFLDRVHEAIDLASAQCLRVQLTLFAFFNGFDDVTGSKRWADRIMREFGADEHVAMFELYNEIDTTNPRTMAWAREMLPHLQTLAGDTPVTLSVSGSTPVESLRRLRSAGLTPDFYDLHYYGLPELARPTFEEVVDIAGTTPVFVGETGYSSLVRLGGYSESWWQCYQAHYLSLVSEAAAQVGVGPVSPWTYTDFMQGAFPAGSNAGSNVGEYEYGLVATSGALKPAATVAAAWFAGESLKHDNAGFEDGDDTPDCWTTWQKPAAEFARDETVFRSGAASARMSSSSSTPVGRPAFYLTPSISIVPDQRYTASAWAQGTRATGATYVALAWFDDTSRYIGSVASDLLPLGDSVWTQLQVSTRAPADAAFVQLHLVSTDNSGTVWFDDVSFG